MSDSNAAVLMAAEPMAVITESSLPALVLIVDDDETVRLLAGGSLESVGFRIIEAGDGESALSQFNTCKPDLILLDVMMSGMDGFEVCRAIRTSPGGEHTPILMMTGLDDVESINRAYDLGATDFAPKPVNFALLGHRVRYILRAKATADALRYNQARLANAQRIARLAHWEWDSRTHQVLWSQEFYAICGFQPGDIPDNLQGFIDIVHADDKTRVTSALRELVEHDRSCNLEHRIVHKDGSERIVYQEGRCVPGDNTSGKRIIGTLQDITQRKVAEQRIYHLSHFDSLTGLPNRDFVKKYLDFATAAASRSNTRIALMSIGIDNFQRVNDTLGHVAGDRLLTAVVKRLQATLRGSDCVARYHDHISFSKADGDDAGTLARLGGDEFVVVLTNINRNEDPGIIARRITDCMATPFNAGNAMIQLTISIGIILYPENGSDTDTLLQNASTAMHSAKDSSQNNFRYYSDELNDQARLRFQLELDLRAALDGNQFELHYQPKVSAHDGIATGMEALIRWNHPQRGMVSPDQFIGVSEETGLIIPMGSWVIRTACAQIKTWESNGYSCNKVAVNISGFQFRDKNLLACIRDSLACTGLDPEHLEIEITEGTLMADTDASRKVLCEIKSMGIGIALDDFGTGYSSLSYLKKFPIDRLKIDRSFIRDLNSDDEESATIVRAIIGMCRGLRISVIAEGVETLGAWEYLRELGCDELQGYYFSRPLPPQQYAQWVNRNLRWGQFSHCNIPANSIAY